MTGTNPKRPKSPEEGNVIPWRGPPSSLLSLSLSKSLNSLIFGAREGGIYEEGEGRGDGDEDWLGVGAALAHPCAARIKCRQGPKPAPMF